MAIPHAVLAAGWIPFVVVLVLILFFAFVYIRYYQSQYDKELCSTITSMLGLAVALITCALIPVDIFLVSYMKHSNGTFKDWAQDAQDREDIEHSVLYAYYALYMLMVVFLFIILPLSYFFYEEGDENTSTKQRCCTAVKFSFVFILLAVVLFLIGAFVPFKTIPQNTTDTEWDKIKNIVDELGNNQKEFILKINGTNAISFIVSFMALIGMLLVVVYTAYGMSAWPMDLVKGRRNVQVERLQVTQSKEDLQTRVDIIKNRYDGGNKRITGRDRRRLEELEEKIEVINRRERHLVAADNSCLRKCAVVLRPFQIVFGIVFFLLALLIFISLLLTNIDKIMHSLGPHMGYALPTRTLPNPLDITLVFAQMVFPLDYLIIVGIIMYLFFCSMTGIQHIGVWFCWIRMYKIRPRRTKPQGLLFLAYLLMFIVLALSVLIYMLAPQYTTYGGQHYMRNVTVTVTALTGLNETTVKQELMPCSTEANRDQCVMTRMAWMLLRFFYKLWFFGAAYYWCSWAFLGVFLLGFVIALIRKRRSYIEGAVDEDDFHESDEELLDP